MIWYNRYYTTERILKDFGTKLEKTGMLVEDNKRSDFFYPLQNVLYLEEGSFTKILENGFLDKIEIKFKMDSDSFYDFLKKHSSTDTENLTDGEILKLYRDYNEIFSELNYFIFVVVKFGLEILIRKIREFITDQKIFDTLSKPKNLPYLSEYELDILRGEESNAEDLSKKWFWIPYDYYGADEWAIDFFIKKVKEPKDKERLHYLSNYSSLGETEKNSLMKRLGLNGKQRAMIDALQRINFLQDIRKKITNQSYPFYQKKIIAEFSRRSGIKKEIIWVMTPKEIELSLGNKLRVNEERLKFCAIEIFGNEFAVHEKRPEYLINKDEEDIEVSEFTGVSASAGVAKGKVRICKTSQEVRFMVKGEILVAPATTPDFILGFGKAIAIVTDEGGMTSHAAIVSREMNLPCVVGTNRATRVLKNGDLIEVDATKGKIKIIKRSFDPT